MKLFILSAVIFNLDFGGNDIASEMREAISFPPIETGYESTPNEQLYTHSTTDHLYIDMKLTDIAWPTKILLPCIRHYRY